MKAKTPFGETYEVMTAPYPNTVPSRMARIGTPRRLSLARNFGASPRSVSANSMREDAYSPEFSADSTAVSTTPFMICAAADTPMTFRALTYGVVAALEFQGTRHTTRRTEPT